MIGVGAYFLEQSVKDILVIFLFAIGILICDRYRKK